jgi:hypothetical protein
LVDSTCGSSGFELACLRIFYHSLTGAS